MAQLLDKNGLTIVYTGNGKGKTTAALGLIMRAAGIGMKVLLVHFLKNSVYSEHNLLEKIDEVDIHIFGKGFCGVCGDTLPFKKHKQAANEAYDFACKNIISNKYDLIVLDEINYAVSAKLLKVKQITELISTKPKNVHLVLTGRDVSPSVIKKADLVSEIHEIKHPFQKGVQAQKGIEF